MRHMVRIAVAVMAASLLAGVTLSANDDDELRIRRNQLVILNATPDCDAGMITIAGENYGTLYVPHVTLNLVELDVMRAVSVKWWKSHSSSGTVIMPPVLRARALGTRLTPAG